MPNIFQVELTFETDDDISEDEVARLLVEQVRDNK